MSGAQIIWAKEASQLPFRGDIPVSEVAKHNQRTDCWVILQGYVYDVTSYLDHHPGGVTTIMDEAGKDITRSFMSTHRWISPNLIEKLKIGKAVQG